MFVRGGALSRLVRAGGRMIWRGESHYSHFASPGTAKRRIYTVRIWWSFRDESPKVRRKWLTQTYFRKIIIRIDRCDKERERERERETERTILFL